MKEVTMEQIQERGINRLCHFTKAKNLTYILEDLKGILASELRTLMMKIDWIIS